MLPEAQIAMNIGTYNLKKKGAIWLYIPGHVLHAMLPNLDGQFGTFCFS
jgi:hypothetical protein